MRIREKAEKLSHIPEVIAKNGRIMKSEANLMKTYASIFTLRTSCSREFSI
jgi:hypothetical protein